MSCTKKPVNVWTFKVFQKIDRFLDASKEDTIYNDKGEKEL